MKTNRYGQRVASASAIFVTLLSLSRLTRAQSDAPDVGVKEESPGLSVSVLTGTAASGQGSLASVDGVTGAATANLPIALPRARGRAQPTLGLHYNSQRGITDAGLGWGLDMPSIVQRRLWNSPADGSPATNIFEFAGHPLVPICVIGTSGTCDSSEPQTWASGWTYFRRQVEGGFERFYLSPYGRTWRVLRKDGIVEIYGCFDTFEVGGISQCAGLDVDDQVPTGRLDALGTTAAFYRWHLAAAFDLQAGMSPRNLVVYRWTHLDNPSEPTFGPGYLSDIYYTPPVSGGTSTSTFAYHVHLSYQADSFVGIRVAPIWKAVPSFLISGIDITSKPFSSPSQSPRALVRRYHLTYATALPDNGRSGTLLPELTQFQLEGRCAANIVEGASYLLPATNCTMWPATTMEYVPWDTLPIMESLYVHEGAAGDGSANAFQRQSDPLNAGFIDVNGDGLPDMIAPEPAEVSSTGRQHLFMNGATPSYSPGVDLVSSFMPAPDALSTLLMSSGDFVPDGNTGLIDIPLGRSFVGDWLATGQTAVLFSPMVATPASGCNGCYGATSALIVVPTVSEHRWSWTYATPPGSISIGNVPPFSGVFPTSGKLGPTASIPVDINADGLLDSINVSPWTDTDSNTTYVQLALQLSARTFPNTVIPFVTPSETVLPPDPNLGPSYVPSHFACGYDTFPGVPGGLFGKDFANVQAADLNGDGLPDLFAAGKVVFGTGTNFDCQGFTSGPNNHEGAPISGPPIDWAHAIYWLHDLNADGLADLIIASDDGLKVYLNNGAARITLAGSTFNSVVFDPTPAFSYSRLMLNAALGHGDAQDLWRIITEQGTNATYPSVRIAFADMNGSGTDDLVFVATNPSIPNGIVHFVEFEHPAEPFNQQVGLMTSITNGYGASAQIRYQNLGGLENAASFSGTPWKATLPQVLYAVTDLEIRNNIGGDSERDEDTQFIYRDPAYDAWRRQFKGFRDVTTVKPSGRTEITYQIITCQDVATIAPIISSGPNPYPSGQCETNSDRDLLMSLPPLRVLEQITDGSGTIPLTTTHWEYLIDTLLSGIDGRSIWFPYVTQTDTYLWDSSGPTMSVANVVDATWTALGSNISGGDVTISRTIEVPSVQSGSGQHLQVRTVRDYWGNVLQEEDRGRVDDVGNGIDMPILTSHFMSVGDRGLVRISLVGAFAHVNGVPDGRAHERVYSYDDAGNVIDVYGVLSGTAPLDRFHATGATVAPRPVAASSDGVIHLVHNIYDPRGFLIQSQGPDNHCVRYSADPDYGQFMTGTSRSPTGCGGAIAVSSTTSYDRGLQSTTSKTGSDGAIALTTYDEFGRVQSVTAADPALFGVAAPAPSWVVNRRRSPDGHFEIASAFRGDGAITVTYQDGFGQTLLTIRQVDDMADGTRFVASGAPLMGPCGPIGKRRPWRFSGDLGNAYAPTDSHRSATPTSEITYDPFCRNETETDYSGAIQSKTTYHALSTDTWDAADLTAADPVNVNTPTTSVLDGHGRLVQSIARTQDDTITTSYTYQSTGETNTVIRSDTKNKQSYKRWMEYDSFGRMVVNAEPNTTTTFSPDPASAPGMHAWRYAYDDLGDLVGTSDARGCGENFSYDAVGRLTAEDYSPCTAAQSPYTSAPEVTYLFDLPESADPAGAFAPETAADYGGDPGYLNGRLAAVRDRGAHTRFAYDGRGRVTAFERQAVLPVLPSGVPSSVALPGVVYDPTWFRKTFAYTDWDNLESETTGADQPQLMGSDGTSTIAFGHSARDLLVSMSGSYGMLVRRASYDAAGSPTVFVYGDIASTQETWTYDNSERLLTDIVARSAPALWSAAKGSYPGYLPPSLGATTQLKLRSDSIVYDAVLNPLTVADGRDASEWKKGAKPVTRVNVYDALYRLTHTDYNSGGDSQVSPFAAENAAGNVAPVPALVPSTMKRVQSQSFAYDVLGNVITSTDDANVTYDRSLGNPAYGPGPNQLSTFGPSGHSRLAYDSAGNLIGILVYRAGTCTGREDACVEQFAYEWDEVGRLARARRWDFRTEPASASSGGTGLSLPATAPQWDISYGYDSSGGRVERQTKDASGNITRGLEIFDTLRLDNVAVAPATFVFGGLTLADEVYSPTPETETIYLPGGLGRLMYDPRLPSPRGTPLHVFLEFPDELGSTSMTIDSDTSELVEAETYQSYGATDSDYRPARWNSFRESYRFTGKEDDIQAGVIYFGARYYQPQLGRWTSPDPMTIHGLGSDLNPYAYVSEAPTNATDPVGLNVADEDTGLPPKGDSSVWGILWAPDPVGGAAAPSSGASSDDFSDDPLGSAAGDVGPGPVRSEIIGGRSDNNELAAFQDLEQSVFEPPTWETPIGYNTFPPTLGGTIYDPILNPYFTYEGFGIGLWNGLFGFADALRFPEPSFGRWQSYDAGYGGGQGGAMYLGMVSFGFGGAVEGATELEAELPEFVYHYTSEDTVALVKGSELLGARGRPLYLTTQGGLSPTQAGIELGLPQTNTARVIYRVPTSALDMSRIVRNGPVTGSMFGRGGGGIEIMYRGRIPIDLVKQIR